MKKLILALFLFGCLHTPSLLAEFYVIAGGKPGGTEIKSLPYIISEPGFYFLRKDLSSAGNGIVLGSKVEHVTIDLMGHTITGPGNASGIGIGIYLQSQNKYIVIRNGSISDFGDDGIQSNYGTNNRFIDLLLTENGSDGIYAFDDTGDTFRHCTASYNKGYGIVGGLRSVLEGNTVIYNQGYSALAAYSGSVRNNIVSNNNQFGIYVINHTNIEGNNVTNNGFDGIYCISECLIKNNVVNVNGRNGINSGNSLVSNNLAVGNNQSGGIFVNILCTSCTFVDNKN